jgi:hypothetical protein
MVNDTQNFFDYHTFVYVVTFSLNPYVDSISLNNNMAIAPCLRFISGNYYILAGVGVDV